MHDYGIYRCKFWDKHLNDAESLPTIDCRFWPEVRHVSPHNTLTTRINVSPHSAKSTVSKSHGLQVWREEDVNIAESRLIGPFNFTLQHVAAIPNKRRATTKYNLIDSTTCGLSSRPFSLSKASTGQTSVESYHATPQKCCPTVLTSFRALLRKYYEITAKLAAVANLNFAHPTYNLAYPTRSTLFYIRDYCPTARTFRAHLHRAGRL